MKFRPSQLVKFLQAIPRPIFFIDGDSTLLFCNKALEDWTGCEAEKLVGQKLRYRGSASRLKHEIIAAALAPPPEVFQGRRCRVPLMIDHITSQSRRLTDFHPFGEAGVIALVDGHETRDDPALSETTVERQAASDLHQTLLSFRRRQAGRFRWDRMIGSSPQMQRIRRLARLAVESAATVLIVGQIGTGKEHLASSIHYGAFQENPGVLLPVDCRGLDHDLIASTVYAFRKRFQREEGQRRHTLLLTEADRLPDSLYSLIADFVTANPARLRVIATSTLTPDAWSGKEPFAILLGTILIELPALKQRRDDIPMLAQMFLEERNETVDRQRAGFSSEALDALLRYPWPENIDELERMVGSACDRSTGTLISPADLPHRIHHYVDAVSEPVTDDEPIDLESFLGNIERELVVRALRRARGNKSLAAEMLGITRARFYRRLETFGLLDSEPEEEPRDGNAGADVT